VLPSEPADLILRSPRCTRQSTEGEAGRHLGRGLSTWLSRDRARPAQAGFLYLAAALALLVTVCSDRSERRADAGNAGAGGSAGAQGRTYFQLRDGPFGYLTQSPSETAVRGVAALSSLR
jgi:hypothetical protein